MGNLVRRVPLAALALVAGCAVVSPPGPAAPTGPPATTGATGVETTPMGELTSAGQIERYLAEFDRLRATDRTRQAAAMADAEESVARCLHTNGVEYWASSVEQHEAMMFVADVIFLRATSVTPWPTDPAWVAEHGLGIADGTVYGDEALARQVMNEEPDPAAVEYADKMAADPQEAARAQQVAESCGLDSVSDAAAAVEEAAEEYFVPIRDLRAQWAQWSTHPQASGAERAVMECLGGEGAAPPVGRLLERQLLLDYLEGPHTEDGVWDLPDEQYEAARAREGKLARAALDCAVASDYERAITTAREEVAAGLIDTYRTRLDPMLRVDVG